MKTANDLAGAATTLASLEQLRHAIREAITRGEQADRDYRTRAERLGAQFNQAIENERSRFATEMESGRTAAETRRNSIESYFTGRKARLSRALGNARQRKFGEIDAEESRHTFAIQRDLLEADRVREADTAVNKATHAALIARLAEELTDLEQIQATGASSLAAFPLLRKKLNPPTPSPSEEGSQNPGASDRSSPPGRGQGWVAPATLDATILAKPEAELVELLHDELATARDALGRIHKLVLPLLFKMLPVWLWIIGILGVPVLFIPALRRFDLAAVLPAWWVGIGVGLAAIIGLFLLGRRVAAAPAQVLVTALTKARQLHALAVQKTEATFNSETKRIQAAHASTTSHCNSLWKQKQIEAKKLRDDWSGRLEQRARTLNSVADGRRSHRLAQIDHEHAEHKERLIAESAARQKTIEATQSEGLAKLAATRDAVCQEVEKLWQATVLPGSNRLHETADAARQAFPAWQPELWRGFKMPEAFPQAAQFAEVSVDLEALCGVRLENERLSLTTPRRFTVPLLLAMPDCASVLFETKQSGQQQVIGALNNLILRLLTSAPPGRLEFTIFDPVGLGQNFAGIMHLADFEERLINSRIWTQQAQIEQRLADLNEHIEKVTQMYLRNEYATLAEYNAQAGRMAEKYHFLVIADFPVNFSDIAVKRLQNIATSGPRCGVHLLIHWDQRRAAPLEFVPDELRKTALVIVPKGEGFAIASCPATKIAPGQPTPNPSQEGNKTPNAAASSPPSDGLGVGLTAINTWDGLKLTLDAPPDAELATRLLNQIGKDSIDSNRVEMPFVEAAPELNEFWTLDTTSELRVPVGRTGATKLQYLALGKGTRQHALVAGKTGSGKSTLFHVIITNLALWCSPDQVEFYLVDFKKGVEFKCYATHKLPHARVIAIESDREFGLSVLQRLDEELKRRGDLFRKLGAQDIAGYKRAVAGSGTGVSPVQLGTRPQPAAESPSTLFASPDRRDACPTAEPMPRVLLLIDEFQELFVEDDRVSQGASLLLDRIVRQGRAFGIHVILGSQTLGGAYTLARATMGQMVVRIALQCNEADAYLIMNEDNAAPRLLSRPGEAIYNDDAGTLQGNSPFQVVWLPDQERDEWLDKVAAQASASSADKLQPEPQRAPIVFEGNAPADVRENPLLRAALASPTTTSPTIARVWLGAPNSIKGPTEAVFRRASGSHLLIVGQRDEAALAMLCVSLVSLAAQHPQAGARFLVFDCSTPESMEAKLLEATVAAVPHEARLIRPGEVDAVMAALAAEQKQCADNPGAATPETYLIVHGLHRNKKLRFDEEMSFSLDDNAASNPGLLFNKLITEGAGLGFHVIATCDTYNNLMRMLSRKAVSEFEMRVVFQMSANDSASLIESPQANNLGLHRAIFFNGHEGWVETFRPYALPETSWLAEVGSVLKSQVGGGTHP